MSFLDNDKFWAHGSITNMRWLENT